MPDRKKKHKVLEYVPFGDSSQYTDDNSLSVKIKFENKLAIMPNKGSLKAAAYDVYAPRRIELVAGKTEIVGLGFKVEIPSGYELKLIPRSGLSTKGVTIRNSPGTIDEDYRGEVGVILKYEPEDLCHRVEKLYKALAKFCRNLVSSHQQNLDDARNRLLQQVEAKPMEPYVIEAGDRIGQLQLQRVVEFSFKETHHLTDTTRGEGGFGSTGK